MKIKEYWDIPFKSFKEEGMLPLPFHGMVYRDFNKDQVITCLIPFNFFWALGRWIYFVIAFRFPKFVRSYEYSQVYKRAYRDGYDDCLNMKEQLNA